MQKLPCEVAVWDTLPAIRAAIASEMVAAGLPQNRVAAILGLAPSAVSQYLSGKRGYRIVFSDEVREMIARTARDISSGEIHDLGPRICEICVLMRESNTPCHLCGEES